MTDKKETVKLNLQQKLLEAKKQVPYFKKDKAGHQYKYASPDVVLGTLNPILNELGIRLKTEITDVRTEKVFQKPKSFDVYVDGKKTTEVRDVFETMYHLTFRMTWIDVETNERDENAWFASGVNGHELGAGSACTYSERYFLLKQFNIPTGDDDPDSFQHKHMTDAEKQKLEAEQAAVELAHIESLKTAAIEALKSFTTTDKFVGFKEQHVEAMKIPEVVEFSKTRFAEAKKLQDKLESNPAGLKKKENDEPNEPLHEESGTTVGEMLQAVSNPDQFLADTAKAAERALDAIPVKEIISMSDEAFLDLSKVTGMSATDLTKWAKSTAKKLTDAKEPADKIAEFKAKANEAVAKLL